MLEGLLFCVALWTLRWMIINKHYLTTTGMLRVLAAEIMNTDLRR